MMEFSFATLVPGYDTVFRGRSEDEIIAQISTHVRERHAVDELPSEIVDTIRASILKR